MKNTDKNKMNICFIFGPPRSGTTWLWGLINSFDKTEPITFGQKTKFGYTTSESGLYVKNPNNAKEILIEFISKSNKLFVEKTPLHLLQYKKIISDFNQAKFIFIDRHPLGIVNSILKSDMLAFDGFDVNQSIKEYRKYYKNIKSIRDDNRVLKISYDDLQNNLNDTLISISNYLNLTGDIEQIIKENEGNVKVSVKGAFRKGKLKSYLEDLTYEQLKKISKEIVGEIKTYEEYWYK